MISQISSVADREYSEKEDSGSRTDKIYYWQIFRKNRKNGNRFIGVETLLNKPDENWLAQIGKGYFKIIPTCINNKFNREDVYHVNIDYSLTKHGYRYSRLDNLAIGCFIRWTKAHTAVPSGEEQLENKTIEAIFNSLSKKYKDHWRDIARPFGNALKMLANFDEKDFSEKQLNKINKACAVIRKDCPEPV